MSRINIEVNVKEMNKYIELDKKTIFEILEYLNKRLKENQLYLEITVYGGLIMTFIYDIRPAVKDIDCIFNDNNEKIFNNILNQTQFVFDLSNNWLEESIKEPLNDIIKDNKEIYKIYSNLKILRPKKEQLLAMKILSAIIEKDLKDAVLLCKDLDIVKKKELINIFSDYIPKGLLKERQLRFIKYIGENLNYDWK